MVNTCVQKVIKDVDVSDVVNKHSTCITENEPRTVAEAPGKLLALALEKQADPEIIKKMMDLQERWEAGQARKAFVLAMTAFKQEAPSVLRKGDRVDFTSAKGRTTYNYANLGSIIQEITAILGKHELSASWNTSQAGNNITVACHLTHVAGHRESVTLTGPADDSGNKNHIQAIGSTVTYLQRYTLLAALGLATGEDDNGQGGKPPVRTPQSKSSPATPPPTTGDDIMIGVADVTITTGETLDKKTNKMKAWTKYHIKDTTGNTWTTFDKKIAEEAKKAKESGEGVTIKIETKGQYTNIVSIAPIPSEIEPETCPDDPELRRCADEAMKGLDL